MLNAKSALIVMAKRPLSGQSKTRLMPAFSAAAAAQLYECFLRDVLDLVRSLPHITPIIAYTPLSEAAYFRELAPAMKLIPQQGQTLGERLDHVLSSCLNLGYRAVAAVNSDSPTLPASYLAQAFTELETAETDLVLGPCEDGGYYLIGWKRPYPQLVREVTMSTSHVLQDTLALAQRLNLNVRLLPAWYDVDTAADVARVWAELAVDTAVGRHTRQFLLNLQLSDAAGWSTDKM